MLMCAYYISDWLLLAIIIIIFFLFIFNIFFIAHGTSFPRK